MNYLKRAIEVRLDEYLSAFPVVGLTGPRQSGKSTLLLNRLKDYQYVTFDDHRMVEAFTYDPTGFMQNYSDRVIFDEVQYVPEIFTAVKMAVDSDRQNYGKYVMTGSSQFAFLKQISESLAGRIGLLQLLPMQLSEIAKPLQRESLYRGSYPEIIANQFRQASNWYASYVDTYLNKDVHRLYNVGALRDFQRLLTLLASEVGQQVNYSVYARKIGVSVTTIKRWISILEASYVIFLISPFHENFGKRLVKSPKLYFIDTGLACHLLSIETELEFEKSLISGRLFENHVVSEVHKKMLHQRARTQMYYIRTSDGYEVDLVLDKNEGRQFIEIKKNTTYQSKMIKNLDMFIQQENDRGVLLYRGESFPHPSPISVRNYIDYLQS